MTNNYVTAQACSTDGRLTPHQIAQWRTEGYTFVSALLPEDLFSELERAARSRFPAADSEEVKKIADFGSSGQLNFPSQVESLNKVTLHESILDGISDLLDTRVEDLRLTQSDLWPKYGRLEKVNIQDNSDQRIHVDYPNHTLAHPAPWQKPEAVELIVYLSHVGDTGGSTAVVPREGPEDPAYRWPIVDSPGIGNLRYINDKEAAETYFAEQRPELASWRQLLYEREKLTYFKPGDVLFYRHDTWHRGTPMQPRSLRLVHNITYRKAACEWISTLHIGWAWKAYRDNKFLEKLIAQSSLQQRAVLGFPQPGSDYWCEETINAIDARYGMFGMDMNPYQNGLSKKHL